MKNFTLFFYFILLGFIAKAQTGYHITYDDYYISPYDSMWVEGSVKTNIVFNESACYFYLSKYGRPKYKTNTIKIKIRPHDAFYVKSKDVWYHQNYKGKKKYWDPGQTRDIDWRILPDSTKWILGYNCTQAWGLVKGSIVYIWFTKEIPGDYGPTPGVKFPGVALSSIYNSKSESVASKIKIDNYKLILPKLEEVVAVKFDDEK